MFAAMHANVGLVAAGGMRGVTNTSMVARVGSRSKVPAWQLPTSPSTAVLSRVSGRARVVLVRAAAPAGPNPRGGRKISAKKITKKKQEFIEQDVEKDAMAAAMREAARKASASSNPDALDAVAPKLDALSFEAKLAAVREAGSAVRDKRITGKPKIMDEIISSGQGGNNNKSIYDLSTSSSSSSSASSPDGELNTLVRVGAGILTIGLVAVFIPSDLSATAPVQQQTELSPEVQQEVKKQAEVFEKTLEAAPETMTPEDMEKALKGAAESYIVLENYKAAIPLLDRLLLLVPSVENASNLAETCTAAELPFKAAEIYRLAIEAEWSGPKPSPSLLKGLVDSLDKDGRYGLSLSYIKDFKAKGYADDVDAQLLEARVYSGWKGHGKDAEEAYQRVITAHGEDFRGYLAKGVFFREIGRPAEADSLFRQAKTLAPKEMAEVVSAVIQQAKSQN